MAMINLATDKYSAIGEMIEFCIQNDVVSYARLLLFAKENRQDTKYDTGDLHEENRNR